MSATRHIELLDQLCQVADDQVEAARSMDIAGLKALNTCYGDLVFELDLLPTDDLDRSSDGMAALRSRLRHLQSAHERVVGVSQSVMAVLHQIVPGPPEPTYGRTGRLG